MIGRGAARPATTPQRRELAPWRAMCTANQVTRGSQLEGMKRMFGQAENPPSDAAATPVRRDKSWHQHGITPVPFHLVGA